MKLEAYSATSVTSSVASAASSAGLFSQPVVKSAAAKRRPIRASFVIFMMIVLLFVYDCKTQKLYP